MIYSTYLSLMVKNTAEKFKIEINKSDIKIYHNWKPSSDTTLNIPESRLSTPLFFQVASHIIHNIQIGMDIAYIITLDKEDDEIIRRRNSMRSYINRTIQITLLLGLFLVAPITGKTLEEVQFHILPQSALTLQGNSTLHKFALEAQEVNGSLVINKADYQQDPLQSVTDSAQGQVKIPVSELSSGEKGLDNNMKKAMDAKKYPVITYRLTNVILADSATTDSGWTRFQTTGALTIHGVTKTISMVVLGKQINENQLRFKGQKSIKMSDFGVKPPVLMFGAIKTDDTIIVNFNLLVEANHPLAVLTQPARTSEQNIALK